MFWMRPGGMGRMFLLPGIAAFVTGTILLTANQWLDGASDARAYTEERNIVNAYVDGEPVKSYIKYESKEYQHV